MMRKNTVIGFIAGLLASIKGKRHKVAAEDFKRMEFSTNTQRLGVRFTDRIRDVFRFRWIRRA
ncbi:MAG: hypothetical protein JW749_00015 [Sedimentisphaerales bacterium]|nr:hypothetical protein [Sedimentisphaerales bacterium]